MSGKKSHQVKKLIEIIEGKMTRDELQLKLELKDKKSFRELYLNIALELDLIEMNIVNKAKSPNQKYKLTKKGENIKYNHIQN